VAFGDADKVIADMVVEDLTDHQQKLLRKNIFPSLSLMFKKNQGSLIIGSQRLTVKVEEEK
jgi:hypothetical protein